MLSLQIMYFLNIFEQSIHFIILRMVILSFVKLQNKSKLLNLNELS